MPRGTSARMGREFRLYLSGQGLSQLGSAFTAFALPLVVYRLTGSALGLAFTMVAEFVPYLLFGLLLGAVADRVDRRRMMILVDLARAGFIAVLPILHLAGELRVEYVYAVAFIQATLGILFDAGEFAAIPALVGTDELVVAGGRVLAVNQLGQVAGPLLAGLVVALLAPAELLFVDAATFAVSAGILATIRRSLNPAGEAPDREGHVVARLLRDVREGLAYVLSHPVLRTVSIMMALINFVASSANAQLVLFAKERLHASDQRVGWLFAAGSAGVVLVGLTAGWWRRRLPFPVVALGTLMVSGLMLAAFGLTPWYWPALVLWAGQSGFGLLLNINTGALRQAITPNQMLGRVMSIAGVLAWSAIPLGSLAGAAVIQASGRIDLVYCAMGLGMAGIAAAFWFSPVRHGQRYLDEARERNEQESLAG